MAAELKVSGRMTVKRLKENFKNEFEGTLRIYNGREKADDNATLASIRRNNDAKGGELVCNGNLTVGSFEKKMLEVFGIKVQVATPDDWMLALDGITLVKLKDIPEKTSKADMESLVAYKRKTKATDEIVENDVDDSLDNNIELSDISKKAAIFLSFTQNEDDEFYCYLHNIIKDGALYCVGENLGEIDCSAVENYDASEYDCCSENIEDEYADVESLAEQLVNDFVEARYDECEQDNGAMAIDDEYTITIFVGDNKVYEQTVCKSVESGNGWTDFDDDEENDENSSEEEYPLIEKLRKAFIVETDDEVYYDAESADEYTQDQFINNIKAQMTDDEVEAFESLQWKGAEAFTNYLEDCPDDFDLRQMIITAAYCTRQCMDIDDDTRLYVDEQLYYFNDCRDFHHKYEADIDLG